MSIVKNITQTPIDLPDARVVGPGRRAARVDVEDTVVAAHISSGALLVVGADDPGAPGRDSALETTSPVDPGDVQPAPRSRPRTKKTEETT